MSVVAGELVVIDRLFVDIELIIGSDLNPGVALVDGIELDAEIELAV